MLKDRSKAELYHELGTLSKAGFPIHKAAEAALDERRPAGQRQFLEDLKRGVVEGNTLSEAAGLSEVGLTQLEVSVLKACEEGGNVPDGFHHLARYFEMRDKARRRIRRGLVYPIVLVHAAIILGSLVLALFSKNYLGGAIKAGLLLLAIYLVVGIAVTVFKGLAKQARTDPGPDRLLRKIPFIGKTRHAFALSRFAEVLRIQLVTGRGPMRGIRDAAIASGSGSLLASVKKHVLPEVENGRRAGAGFKADKGRVFPGAFARAYATAEEAGDVDDEMERWALAFAGQAEDAIEALAKGLPKLVYAVAAGFAIYVIFKMYQTYLDFILKIGEGVF